LYKDTIVPKILTWGYVTLTMPILGWFVIPRLTLATVDMCTTFKDFSFTYIIRRYEGRPKM